MIKVTIIITLIIIAAVTSLGAVGHEDPRRGKNAAAVGIITILALAAIAIWGGI